MPVSCRALLVALGVMSAAPAVGAPELVVLPSAPLEAEGLRRLRVYLVDGNQLKTVGVLKADRGVIERTRTLADGGVELDYRPPKLSDGNDRLRVTGAEATVTLLKPGRPQLGMQVAHELTLGKGQSTEVVLTLRDATGKPLAGRPRLGASVGKVGPLVPRGIGTFVATYTPPEQRFPQAALLVATAPTLGAFALAPLRLVARVAVPGEGEAGGTMQIAVDGKVFGPVPIGVDGKFTLPIVVGPGGRAVGTSTDRLGNVARREIELGLPAFAQLMVTVLPSALPADGHATGEVVVFAVDERGQPERTRAPTLSAERGTLNGPSPRGDGAWSWRYTAPSGVGSGTVTLTAKLSGAGDATAKLGLRVAPPFRLRLLGTAPLLPAGADEPVPVPVRVEDAGGAPVTGASLHATLRGGRVFGVREEAGGRYVVSVIAPRDPTKGTATLAVELASLTAGAPRRISLHRVPGHQGRDQEVEAWLDDDLAVPVAGLEVELFGDGQAHSAVTDGYGVARFALREHGRLQNLRASPKIAPELVATLDLLRVGTEVRSAAGLPGLGLVDEETPPPQATLEVELPLRPSGQVDLEIASQALVVRRGQPAKVVLHLREPSGRPLSGKVAIELAGGEILAPTATKGDLPQRRRVQLGPNGLLELTVALPGNAHGGDRVLLSATELESRVTVFTELVVQ